MAVGSIPIFRTDGRNTEICRIGYQLCPQMSQQSVCNPNGRYGNPSSNRVKRIGLSKREVQTGFSYRQTSLSGKNRAM